MPVGRAGRPRPADAERRLLGGGSGECVSSRAAAVGRSPRDRRIPYKIVINEVTDVNGDGRVDLADVEWQGLVLSLDELRL